MMNTKQENSQNNRTNPGAANGAQPGNAPEAGQ